MFVAGGGACKGVLVNPRGAWGASNEVVKPRHS